MPENTKRGLTPEEARELHRAGTVKPYGNRDHWVDPRCRLCRELRSNGHAAGCAALIDTGLERVVWGIMPEPELEPMPELELSEARVLRVRPGDVVMFTTKGQRYEDLDAETMLEWSTRLEELLPDGVTAVVLHDIEVTRVTTELELEADADTVAADRAIEAAAGIR